jgi:hypothetical protein
MAACLSCAITQEVQPVAAPAAARVCIRDNPGVRPIFLDTYQQTLESLGYEVRVVSKSHPADCPITSTYDARWSWDVEMYMEYAEIEVFDGDETIGKAVYDAHQSVSEERFVAPEQKIRELVTQLFPQQRVGS